MCKQQMQQKRNKSQFILGVSAPAFLKKVVTF